MCLWQMISVYFGDNGFTTGEEFPIVGMNWWCFLNSFNLAVIDGQDRIEYYILFIQKVPLHELKCDTFSRKIQKYKDFNIRYLYFNYKQIEKRRFKSTPKKLGSQFRIYLFRLRKFILHVVIRNAISCMCSSWSTRRLLDYELLNNKLNNFLVLCQDIVWVGDLE